MWRLVSLVLLGSKEGVVYIIHVSGSSNSPFDDGGEGGRQQQQQQQQQQRFLIPSTGDFELAVKEYTDGKMKGSKNKEEEKVQNEMQR